MKKSLKKIADELGVSQDDVRYIALNLPSDYKEIVGNEIVLNNQGISEIKKRFGVQEAETVLEHYKKYVISIGKIVGIIFAITLIFSIISKAADADELEMISTIILFTIVLGYILFLLLMGFIPLCNKNKLKLTWSKFIEENKKEAKRIKEVNELMEILNKQQSDPNEVRYGTNACPYCGHYMVRFAEWEDKQMSVAFWGGASDKIGKKYKCDHCKKMW
ncbi:MAG: hypothetical protein IKV76_05460 [Clostridia bacterium]|nr:hypothetical protein [Clostridia bacterium]